MQRFFCEQFTQLQPLGCDVHIYIFEAVEPVEGQKYVMLHMVLSFRTFLQGRNEGVPILNQFGS